ncbi:AimR family lysis-lysogeny pheromone receptor [Bacillus cereus]|uniref:AimR family lysis-lysogeny pheromone receptor n=1 Tax=Bacillus cereus TaxID=1396 RepID=UPI00285352A5|nr:AimR family lysis-lysogeny pheromone receptor [Bacillus cereus]MDR4987133.1 AimR family lysis-lysogeny pheromone receptor [Bacillus cereus]
MHEKLKTNGYTNRKLAKRFEVTHTTVNSYFHEQTKFDFMHFVDVLRLYIPEDVELRRACIKKMIPHLSHKNLKLALEVLDMFGEYELQELVIDRIENPILNENENGKKKGKSLTIRTNIKLAEFYKILRKRSEGIISAKDFFTEVNQIRKTQKNKEKDVMILSDLNVIYSFFDLGNYKMVNEYIQEVTPYIDENKQNTLRKSFSLRIKEMEVFTNLHNNNRDEARRLCFEIINDPLNYYVSTKAVAYCKLGESYVIEDYDKSKMYMEKSLEIIGVPVNKKLEIRRNKVLNTLLFLKILHNRDLENVHPQDPAEKAFLLTKLGRKLEAIQILEELKQKNNGLSSFQLYYMGIAKGGIEGKKYLEESAENFSKSGDFFYISLPKKTLECYN